MEQNAWDLLWTPHRIAYIRGESRPTDTEAGPQCPFCRTDDSEEALIVVRGEHTYVVMNLFPYNPGHVLICPYRHVADFTDLTVEESAELSWFQARMMRAIRAASNPQGFNIGLNQGTGRGRRDLRAPAPAHRPALAGGLELHDHRRRVAHDGDAPRGVPRPVRRRPGRTRLTDARDPLPFRGCASRIPEADRQRGSRRRRGGAGPRGTTAGGCGAAGHDRRGRDPGRASSGPPAGPMARRWGLRA